jgi:hypothetical protein
MSFANVWIFPELGRHSQGFIDAPQPWRYFVTHKLLIRIRVNIKPTMKLCRQLLHIWFTLILLSSSDCTWGDLGPAQVSLTSKQPMKKGWDKLNILYISFEQLSIHYTEHNQKVTNPSEPENNKSFWSV